MQPPPDGMITENFSWSEAACRHCGMIPDEGEAAVRETAEWLQEVRSLLGDRVLHVTSWCRCEEHNDNIGGAPNSLHLQGLAVDINPRGLAPHETLVLLAEHQGEGKLIGGLGRNAGFTHIDRGPARRWDGA